MLKLHYAVGGPDTKVFGDRHKYQFEYNEFKIAIINGVPVF